MLNFFSGLLGSIVVIVILQIGCIILSFFIPEFLFRLSKEQKSWHVIAASVSLIFTVVLLTLLHSVSVKSKGKQVTAEPVREAVQTVDFTTRLTNVPFTTNKSAEFGLSIYNDGPKAAFKCFLSVLDAGAGAPLPHNAYTLNTIKDALTLGEGENGACGWSLKLPKAGDYLLDAYVLKEGGVPSNHQQIALSMGGKAAVDPVSTPAVGMAPAAPSAQVAPVTGAPSYPDLIWIYTAKTEGNDKVVAERLQKAGFKNAVPQGHWETETGEQYIFYREKDKAGMEHLTKEAAIRSLQDYHYNGDRVGKRIKNLFVQSGGLKYVMIVH